MAEDIMLAYGLVSAGCSVMCVLLSIITVGMIIRQFVEEPRLALRERPQLAPRERYARAVVHMAGDTTPVSTRACAAGSIMSA